jgi:hypothetical protein
MAVQLRSPSGSQRWRQQLAPGALWPDHHGRRAVVGLPRNVGNLAVEADRQHSQFQKPGRVRGFYGTLGITAKAANIAFCKTKRRRQAMVPTGARVKRLPCFLGNSVFTDRDVCGEPLSRHRHACSRQASRQRFSARSSTLQSAWIDPLGRHTS